MKKLFCLFLLTFVLFSCDKGEETNTGPEVSPYNATINVTLKNCKDATCQEYDPILGVVILFYETEENALYDIDPLRSTHSDQNGKASYSGFDYTHVYVKVEFDNGNYIGPIFTSKNTTTYHNIELSDGCRYDNGSERICDGPINIHEPKVGMSNEYSFFYYDQECIYTDDILQVEVVDVYSDGFRVKEKFTNPSTYLRQNYSYADSVFYSLWNITESSLQLSSVNGGLPASHLMLVQAGKSDTKLDFATPEQFIPFENCKLEYPQLETNTVYLVEDVAINGNSYTNLNALINVNDVSVDAPIANFIYSKETGIIKTYIDILMIDRVYGYELKE